MTDIQERIDAITQPATEDEDPSLVELRTITAGDLIAGACGWTIEQGIERARLLILGPDDLNDEDAPKSVAG